MIDITSMMTAFAALKKIPVEKVVRNASRDFVQGAYKATPTAKISKSAFYQATYLGKKWYIHESQLGGRKIKKAKKNLNMELHKVRIKKGWSKSTWVGAMRALGMETKDPAKRLHPSVKHKSTVSMSMGNTPSVTIVDKFRIDSFGRGSTKNEHERIAKAGFELAAKRLTKEYEKMLKRAWNK